MKITKEELRQIIKEELGNSLKEDLNYGEMLATQSLIKEGRIFFDKVIALSNASEDSPSAAEQLNMIEEALSREVEEKSHGYVRFTIIG